MTSAKNDNVYGIHAVEALLTHSPEKVRALFLSPHRHDHKFKKIIDLAEKNHIIIQKLTDLINGYLLMA